jgi:hypothetical protein
MKFRDLIGRLNWATLDRTPSANCYLACHGKTDGAGAQIQAMMSVMLFAHKFGFKYVHMPFETMELSPDGDAVGWAHAWETTMNLGDGELRQAALTGIPLVPIKNCTRIRKRPGIVQVVQHCHHYADQFVDEYETILPAIRRRYEKMRPARFAAAKDGPLRIALHVKRGNVDPSERDRYTPNTALIGAIESMRGVLEPLGIAHRFELYSMGGPSEFRALEALAPEFHLNESAIDTFHGLVGADILLTAKSSFSYTAALLNGGVKLYEPFWHRPLKDWVTIAGGVFDRAKFGRVVEAHMKRRESR